MAQFDFRDWKRKAWTLARRLRESVTNRNCGRRISRSSRFSKLTIEMLESRSVFAVNPILLSLNGTNPEGLTTGAGSLQYTAQFSETVGGVDAADFALYTTGSASAASTQVAQVDGSTYTITVGGITGFGSIALRLADNGSIRDLEGNGLIQANTPLEFAGQQTFVVGSNVQALTLGDVNGDGKLDLASTRFGVLGVQLGNGDGTFQAQQTYTIGNGAYALTMSDLNGDGKLDLAIANSASSTLSILLGNGNGTLQAQQTYAVGAQPRSLATVDVNGDGKLDLVVANSNSHTIGVLLGNGNGTFQAQQTFAAGNRPVSMTVTDLNADGRLDVVSANAGNNTVSVLLGNGNGTFQAHQTSAVGSFPYSVVSGDLNGDGRRDLIVANTFSHSVSVLLGNGNGTFQAQQTYAAFDYPGSLVLGDVNGDGKLDLAAVVRGAANVLLGNGDGTFQSQRTFVVGSIPLSLASGDLNGDGKLDLVVISTSGNNTVSVLLNAATGNFTGQTYTLDHIAPSIVSLNRTSPSGTIATGTSVTFTATFSEDVTGVDAADFALALSGVATSSLVVTPVSGSVYTITIGGIAGNGTLGLNLVDNGTIRDVQANGLVPANTPLVLTTQQTYAVGSNPHAVTTGDVNGDGKLDLIAANRYSNALSVLIGNGNGTFQAQQTYAVGNGPRSVTMGDVNGDGKFDLVAANYGGNSVGVMLGNGNGTFQAQQTYAVGSQPCFVTTGDANGDGKLDLIAVNRDSNALSVLIGNGNGTFQARQTYAVGSAPYSMTTGDVNGDGKLDLIVANNNSIGTLSVLLGNGNGTFQAHVTYAAGGNPLSVTTGDVNEDGKLDLIAANGGSNTVSVLFGNGNGTFQAQQTYAVGSVPRSVALADINGDGKLDLITADRNGAMLSVLLGNGNGTFQARQTYTVGSSPYSVTTADLNGDGRMDLVVANRGNNTVSVLLNAAAGNFTGQIYTIDQLPTITGVYARGTGPGNANWNASFLSYLAANDLGDATLGYLLSSGGTQLKTLPWTNVDTISIRFSEALALAQGDLSVISAANGPAVPAITGFSWDSTTHTGTWTFAAALPRGKFLLHLGGTLLDTVGNALDGEWTVSSSTSSGNGTAGGDFNFRFNVLPSDFDGNNGVTITEVLQARNRAGKGTGSVGYAYREDIDGNGNITITEVLASRNRTATSITGLNEPVAPGSTPQSPLELAPLVPGEEEGLFVSPYAALTEAELAPIVAEAIARWEASGLVAANFDWSKLRFAITDLGPAYLGLGNPDGAILLDDDGAGWGWFVDDSPTTDAEFATETTHTAAAARMDLLTVVMHEIGHALGYPTGSAQDTPAAALMSELLGVGTRRTPGLAPSEPALSDFLADEAQAAPMLGFARLAAVDYASLALGIAAGRNVDAPPSATSSNVPTTCAPTTEIEIAPGNDFSILQTATTDGVAADRDDSSSTARPAKFKRLVVGELVQKKN